MSKLHNVTIKLPTVVFNYLQETALQTKLPLNDVITGLLVSCVKVMITQKEDANERSNKSGHEEIPTVPGDSSNMLQPEQA